MHRHDYHAIFWVNIETKERRLVAKIRWPVSTKKEHMMRRCLHQMSLKDRPEGFWSYCPGWTNVGAGDDWSALMQSRAEDEGLKLDDSFATWTDELVESLSSELPVQGVMPAAYDKHDLDYANRVEWIRGMRPAWE